MRENWSRTLLVAVSVGLGLGLIEAGSWAWLKFSGRASAAVPAALVREGEYNREYFVPDQDLGYRIRPSRQVDSVLRRGERVIYDVKYTIDDNGFRVTPGQPEASGSFAAFFGGSFMVGEGVEDAETLPARLAYHAGNVAAFNFGVHGWGPQNMLALLQSGELTAVFPKTRGTLVYLYIPAHMARLVGRFDIATGWGASLPHYMIANGRVARRGNLRNGRLLLSSVFEIAKRSNAFKLIGPSVMFKLTPPNFDLLTGIVDQSCVIFRREVSDGECVMLFYKNAGDDFREVRRRNANPHLHLIDISLRLGDADELGIPGDGHPNALAHDRMAAILVDALRQIDR